MYFDFEDYHPDITPVGSVISWREGVLLSIILHLVAVILILLAPRWLPESWLHPPQPTPIVLAPEPKDSPRFVFVQPRVDTPAAKPPPLAPPSDQDRQARSPEQAKEQTNPLPFSRGNTSERVERTPEIARAPEPVPDPLAGQPQPNTPPAPSAENALRLPESPSALQLPQPKPPQQANGALGRALTPGKLGESLANLQRYVERSQFQNSGGGGAFGPAIQFDTKGVEFGPWIRRFIAQVKRNWEPLIPLTAMTNRGHVVVTFNVHKDGALTDIQVIGASPIPAFNTAAYGALSSSNPTAALPPEYPADKAFFTVTFFYNEEPPPQ